MNTTQKWFICLMIQSHVTVALILKSVLLITIFRNVNITMATINDYVRESSRKVTVGELVILYHIPSDYLNAPLIAHLREKEYHRRRYETKYKR